MVTITDFWFKRRGDEVFLHLATTDGLLVHRMPVKPSGDAEAIEDHWGEEQDVLNDLGWLSEASQRQMLNGRVQMFWSGWLVVERIG